MADRSKPRNGTDPVPVPGPPPKYSITPTDPPKGCLWVGGIALGVPAFIVWAKAVAVLANWLLGG